MTLGQELAHSSTMLTLIIFSSSHAVNICHLDMIRTVADVAMHIIRAFNRRDWEKGAQRVLAATDAEAAAKHREGHNHSDAIAAALAVAEQEALSADMGIEERNGALSVASAAKVVASTSFDVVSFLMKLNRVIRSSQHQLVAVSSGQHSSRQQPLAPVSSR